MFYLKLKPQHECGQIEGYSRFDETSTISHSFQRQLICYFSLGYFVPTFKQTALIVYVAFHK